MFVQKLVQAKQQKNLKIFIPGLLWGKPPVTDGFPPPVIRKASIPWSHHEYEILNIIRGCRFSHLQNQSNIHHYSAYKKIVVLPAKHVHSISKEFFDVLFCIYFTGTGEITRLALCQLRGQEKYGLLNAIRYIVHMYWSTNHSWKLWINW